MLRVLNSGDAFLYAVQTSLTVRGYTYVVSNTAGSVHGDTVRFIRTRSSIRMYSFDELLTSKCK